jgi:hypothetical protein
VTEHFGFCTDKTEVHMLATSARRAVVIAVAAGSVATGLITPALAATNTAKTTTLTIHAAKTKMKEHTRDTFTGTLRAGKADVVGEPVKLEQRAYGAKKWSVDASRTTNKKGAVTFTVTPPAPTKTQKSHREQYELVFAGSSAYRASHSGVVTVTVTK